MTYQGTVKNGVVVIETDTPLAQGTRVKVEVERPIPPDDPADDWTDVVLKFAGCMDGLPADFAAEHDHYLHGTPRRSQREDGR